MSYPQTDNDEYRCGVCNGTFNLAEWLDRHDSTALGEVHERCCDDCGYAGTTWTSEHAQLAEAEGWDLFDSEGSEHGPLQAQSFDSPDEWGISGRPYPFAETGDAGVHALIATEALLGSPLHLHALRVLEAENPEEAGRICALFA